MGLKKSIFNAKRFQKSCVRLRTSLRWLIIPHVFPQVYLSSFEKCSKLPRDIISQRMNEWVIRQEYKTILEASSALFCLRVSPPLFGFFYSLTTASLIELNFWPRVTLIYPQMSWLLGNLFSFNFHRNNTTKFARNLVFNYERPSHFWRRRQNWKRRKRHLGKGHGHLW